jgi:hypothetical protein
MLNQPGGFMAQDRNTYAKRQRETSKKQKAADKRVRRQKRKETASRGPDSEIPPTLGEELGASIDP